VNGLKPELEVPCRYEDARPYLKTGDFVLFRGSVVVRWWTEAGLFRLAPWGHVGEVEVRQGVEALPGAAIPILHEYRWPLGQKPKRLDRVSRTKRGRQMLVIHRNLTDYQRERIAKELNALAYTPYAGLPTMVKTAFRRARRLGSPRFCSALVAYCDFLAGVSSPCKNWHNTHPVDLLAWPSWRHSLITRKGRRR